MLVRKLSMYLAVFDCRVESNTGETDKNGRIELMVAAPNLEIAIQCATIALKTDYPQQARRCYSICVHETDKQRRFYEPV